MTYYNTTNESGQILLDFNDKAIGLEKKILNIFRKYPGKKMTPFEVLSINGNINIPITSVRRAMSNLTKEDLLEKTNEKKPGRYGRPNYCWQIKK